MTFAPVEAVMVGAGNRGFFAYGPYAVAHPERIRFVAVAEPHDERRRRFAAAHRIPEARQFRSWEELYAGGRIAEALFNCTLDEMHVASTLPALALGYHLMLEKPMADTAEGCAAIVRAARGAGTHVELGHVLRFTDFYATVHRLVVGGRLGRVISARLSENVSYWHMAHSFVRGNWRRGTPMILAKCCHDLDLLCWMLGPATRLTSYGSLSHYRADQAPAGAPERCTDGCPVEAECPWSAPRLYLSQYVGWPVNVISEDLSLQARRRALERGPYGRCVYRCDNEVVDHQVVALELASGATATLLMHGHSHREERTVRFDGTRATLRGRFTKEAQSTIEIHDHVTGEVELLTPAIGSDAHGGGDTGLMAAFVDLLRSGRPPRGTTGVGQALESHLMAFAAEDARRSGAVVELEPYRRQGDER